MRIYGLGCGGWIGAAILVFILWNIGSCIFGKILDGAQEVVAERHARQEVADQRAREALAREEAAQSVKVACVEAERKKTEAIRKAEAQRQLEKEKENLKVVKLRDFALSDAPHVWNAYQQLGAAIAEQDKRLQDLDEVLKEFGKNPNNDADYKAICAMRDEMVKSLQSIRKNLEEAYLASRKFKATPSRKEYAELMRKAIDDGTKAAEAATRKFDHMRIEK